ncbi:threonylcarbamoyl-AMP synthase [Sandaracinobacter sp. RS1-74]|uniref:L-threonylcarbamoyladenylate synthase n=1 Tax=Sandaracinobacteroides sayramensis TaxID=2913411 RepID=UPI001EDA4D59|nr:L-threonylcarbamoyladenylate synthase [Sandaracinobacteroides sayramensis]MCG2839920.1 threonylcarbamoyl-AMP synthase [Sandaracinobacteroides sayramensis]
MADSTGELTRMRPADAQGVAEAVALLAGGSLVAIPTETVYGLAADAADGEAVARIYAAKGRPHFNPLIVHLADRAMADRYADLPPLAEKLAAAFWPGPLTLVLPLKPGAPVSPLVTAGLPTIALRLPAHPVMRDVVRALGRGVAAPSANASGRLSPTRAAHVAASLEGKVPLVLDGGPCEAGIESSIVAVVGGEARLLRQGAIARESLEAVLGAPLALASPSEPVAAPGMLLSHYAPRLPIRLNAETARAEEFHIGFGPIFGDENLSARGDPVEAAARLFDLLHRADASGRTAIAVAPIPEAGLGAAINDRLRRAASHRSQ